MRKKASIIIAALIMSAGTIMAKDIQTLTVTPQPKMHCSNCETRIKNFLKFEKGIKKIVTNVDAQKITVTYDADKTTEEAIIETFNKNNYEVEKIADTQTSGQK